MQLNVERLSSHSTHYSTRSTPLSRFNYKSEHQQNSALNLGHDALKSAQIVPMIKFSRCLHTIVTSSSAQSVLRNMCVFFCFRYLGFIGNFQTSSSCLRSYDKRVGRYICHATTAEY
ncbi:unnamed protein product [Vicia faba]|uniref:Uncharacterized protein n=1 Tax=Vicia faba TaxID=3906 RepID=A0AAV0ZUU0_VICFA|nr:unnamed protein product [Vicia faba]